ncbi:hypothetical protein KEC49_02420, partial ['Elaeagnus angustifolia' witches'-broom phytoplasma]|nr:hypothetical protein ['Elaeagnus angustifolia' witches'-broom phytoplasma]MCX2955875.1 hypothetical protein [Candidatus Phytoplasma australiense]
KNLKEKYTNDLTQIQRELNATKTENKQLEKEMQEIQDELVKNKNADETLVKQLNEKEDKIKKLKGKISTLEANETQLQTIIKQKDEEINQLQQTIQLQAQEIQRLTVQLERQIDLFVEQGQKILQLEGTIKALGDANSGLSGTNKELQHQINKLKNELEEEKQAHKAMKKKLDKQIVKLKADQLELGNDYEKLKTQNDEWQTKSNITQITTAIGALGGPAGMVVGAATGVVVNEIIDAWKALKRWW